MVENVYLAYFEAVTTNTPGCIEQRKHPPRNRAFAKRENDFFKLDDSGLKTALLSCDEPLSCIFLGVFDEKQICFLEQFLGDVINVFNFPLKWHCVNFDQKPIRVISEKLVSLPLDDSPHMRRPFFCVVRQSDLEGIQNSAIRKRFFQKLERKASLLPKDEISDDDLFKALADERQRKTFASWFCRSCELYPLRNDSRCEVTHMLACNIEYWVYLRANYRSFFLKFLEFAEYLKANHELSEADITTYLLPPGEKPSKKVGEVSKKKKLPAPVPANKLVDEKDRRTPTMLRIQQEAEAAPLPDNDKSNEQWITASDLAGKIVKMKRKEKSTKKVRRPDIDAPEKTAHKTARETLNIERKIGRCIWPPDKETAKQYPLCGWARHERFWRKKEGRPRPIFYYRLTTEKGWQKREMEREQSTKTDAESATE